MEYVQETAKQYRRHQARSLDREKIWKLLALSAGIDIFISVVGTPAWVSTLGSGFVIEELVESGISKVIETLVPGFELKSIDYAIGALPIPGVTAVSVRCVRLLLGMT